MSLYPPKTISRQLPERSQISMVDFNWILYRNLLLWLMCTGDSFAAEQPIRTGFVLLEEPAYSNNVQAEDARSVLK